ncbi:MAG: hypothetical protein CMK33_06145 [Porticoccaceae bacterium]|jgi:3-hydroxyisobutyrate dehydrogenase-like beta-hydroxyacid dehydrogenase|nr:hypothetical protein [Porticoccaceae bacterium]
MKIGFVGLGNRGNAIAVNLLRAGHRLVINDLAREMQSNLEIQGAKWCDDLRLLAQGCEAVFTALPGPAEVEQVMLGDSGVFAGMAPGTSYIDLSTSSAKVAAVLAAAGAERGVRVVHAAMIGGVGNAREASLKLEVQGAAADLEACRPLLEQIAGEIVHLGPFA